MDGLKSIILLGPIGAGKTTLACNLRYKYGFKIITLDDEEFYAYMREQGMSQQHFINVYQNEGADVALHELEVIATPLLKKVLTNIAAQAEIAVLDTRGNKTLFRDAITLI